MKRLLAAAIAVAFPICASAAPTNLAALQAYAEKAMPRCADGKVTLEPIPRQGPAGFQPFGLTLTSSDKTCGKRTFLLYSPTTRQVVIGAVISLPQDGRGADARVSEAVSQMVKQPMIATVSAEPLPDGLRQVTITKQTALGPFSYHALLDASERFLIIGSRGNLSVDAGKTLLGSVGIDHAVRRGNRTAKVEIVELSDFQCPSCGRAHKQVEPLIAKNLSKVNYARLDLPLFETHQWSLPAALGARAIQKVAPSQYWPYVNFIFANQESIDKTAAQNPAAFDTVLKNFCEDHEIDWKAIEPIYRSPSERNALLEQVARMFDSGVTSTPTYIINGRIVGFGPDGKYTVNAIKQAIGVK